jgi:C4-dicarboxylate-specific signal transduction histidine kinase
MSRSGNIPPRRPGDPPLRLVGDEAGDLPWQAPDQPPPQPERLLHELSNLLDGSLRSVGLALARIDDAGASGVDEATRDSLEAAEYALGQMAELMRQWTDHRGGSAPPPPAERQTPLGEVVEQVLGVMRPVAEAQGIALEAVVAYDVGLVAAGPLYPVIVNGVRNAVEAVQHDGRVQIEARWCDDGVELLITDDGPGVPPQLPRDSDGLVMAGVTTKQAGHGLGLAISRDIVRGLGGVIRLEDNDGGGARLVIRLPQPNRPPQTT